MALDKLMMFKCKFKERILVLAVGGVFTVLLVLETTLLNAITPLAKKHDEVNLDSDTHTERTVIFEGIIQNLESHLGVMRRELSAVEEEEVNERLASASKHLELSNPDVKEAISHSRVIQKYAETFIKIADILHKSRSSDSSRGVGGSKAKAVSGNAADLSEGKAIASAWPELGVYSGNVTISNRVHPNGYLKREGRDFELGSNVTKILKDYAKRLAANHKKLNSSEWDNLEVYEETK